MRIIYFFIQVIYLPHFFIFLCSSKKDIIIKDLYANCNQKSNLLNDLTYTLSINSYFRTLFFYRINNFISKLLRLYTPSNKLFIIDINSKIGYGIKLAHPFSTIINAESIGNNLYINHLVTIGEIDGNKPIIGNNVSIHANATIIGGVKIGDNAVIGAGAVVVKDVSKDDIVAGNPAKSLKNKQ